MMLDNFTTNSTNNSITDPVLINSTGPVTTAMEIEIQKEAVRYNILKMYLLNTDDTLDIYRNLYAL